MWTRRLVGELIAKLYQVRLTEPGMGKGLQRWGLLPAPGQTGRRAGSQGRPSLAPGDVAEDP